MIPIRDHNPSGRIPFITYLLIGLNVWVFIQMFGLNDAGLEAFFNRYALFAADILRGQNLLSLLTHMFLHGGLGHLGGNMLFLFIFGDNLEDRLGHFKFLLWYLFCGLGATLLQILVDPASTIPMVGASGAIAGVMGGYLLLFPKEKIDLLFSFGYHLDTITVPAYTMLGYWIIAQALSGFGSLAVSDMSMGGVAYFAHLGGFLSGLLSLIPFRSHLLRPHWYS
jgi:membrane associated rhomboid family serine protease